MLSWLGIGAQRSGTTWFTDLLTQHPQVSLGVSNKKELHLLDHAIGHLDDVQLRAAYAEEYPDGASLTGEFTPAYLRSLWAPNLAANILDPRVVIVILRDPIDRFHSAMRLNRTRLDRTGSAVQKLDRLVRTDSARRANALLSGHARDAQWAGLYGQQLRAWVNVLGHDRFEVIQYESLCREPLVHVERVWRRLGLEPVPLVSVSKRSETSMPGDWMEPDRLGDINRQLGVLYRSQLSELDEFGIDGSLWTTLSTWS